jgi:two-component system, NarL family, invasion response regulator UvrY
VHTPETDPRAPLRAPGRKATIRAVMASIAGPGRQPLKTDVQGLLVGVLVVDDQLVFRQVAHDVIAATERFVPLGEATSGPHALALVAELEPDLILLDVRMPGMDGIETAARLRAEHPEPVVVLITVDEEPELPGELLSCGAAALVRKQDFGPAMLRRIWAEHGFESPAPPRIEPPPRVRWRPLRAAV